MNEEKMLTVRDVSLILGISEREVMDLAEGGALPGYKIGGVYLRFKKEQILEFQKTNKTSLSKSEMPKYSFKDRLWDFFYFNDFYILAVLIVLLLLVIIFKY
jgi:excisionase family DNA binding protein